MDIVPLKQCTVCKEFFPATTEYFPRRPDRPSGIKGRCKKCRNAYRRQNYALTHPVEIIPDGYRKCSLCREIKPATTEFFHGDKGKKGGLHHECKECRKIYDHNLYVAKHPPKPNPIPDGHKKCSRCKQIKPATNEYFSRNRNKYDGWNNECKACDFERRQSDSAKEKKRVYNHTYQLTHADVLKPRHRAYHQTHLPQRRASRLRRAEYYAEQDRQYRQTHREQRRILKLNRLAREKSIPGTHTAAQIAEQLKRQHYKCYYASCGFSKFPRSKDKDGTWKYEYHVEHTYPTSRVAGMDIPANDMGYLVLSCKSCNSRKGKKFPWEWYEGGRLL